MLMNSRIVQNTRGNFGFLSIFHAVGGSVDSEFSGMSEPDDWEGGGLNKFLQVVLFPSLVEIHV